VATLRLSERTASALAYAAGWLSGWVVLTLEGRRRQVRVHAAQALIGFGLLTLLSGLLLLAAGLSLVVSVTVFRVLIWSLQIVLLLVALLWVGSIVQAARGRDWRWPLIGRWVDALAALTSARPS